jgi:hypothetical protein
MVEDLVGLPRRYAPRNDVVVEWTNGGLLFDTLKDKYRMQRHVAS